MATGKITITSLRDLQGWLWDTSVVGFGARRQRNGVFYYLRYRHAGSQRMQSIGRHGSPWTPDTARVEARRLLGVVAGGDDPFAQAMAGEGFGAAVQRYLQRKQRALKPRGYVEVVRYLTKSAEPLHRLSLGDIDRRTIAALLAQIEEANGPVARNRCRSALSSFFSWTVTEGLLDINPVQGTAKVDEAGGRERVLTNDELRKLWAALRDDSFGDIIRLLVLTGQRRNEIGKLQWSEIDFARKLIVLPAERTKNSRQHELPLSSQALEILQRRDRADSFVFDGFGSWAHAKEALDKRLGIAPFRLHDLRRTSATGIAELGVQPHVIESVLNHVSGHKAGVAGIYNRSKLIEPMRSALQLWADHVDQITLSQ
jgi:integrase